MGADKLHFICFVGLTDELAVHIDCVPHRDPHPHSMNGKGPAAKRQTQVKKEAPFDLKRFHHV
jgi:hypothetical protein